MKIKDLERTANIAWSPAKTNPIYLAAGTAAQQLDASFSTNASLEIFALNLTEPGSEMEQKVCVSSEHRFHKLVWGPAGGGGSGTIVAGCDGGVVKIYDAGKLLLGEKGLTTEQNKHTGSVFSLDFNPFQENLLATGATESEIYIWDINNTTSPMTPGAKSQPPEDILSIQWNRQVQHILASTFTSKCVVWDLRKNEPIIKLTDTVSRIRWKVVAWHPEVATQLCLASEEDQAPVIQLWDLRFATSPLKTLEGHQRGILSIAWCSQDADLLISCAKDNRIVCWNPNTNKPGGEILSEVAKTSQWNFDIAWCPKSPALIASPGYDGHVSVYSLMGGKAQQIQTTNKIADSFPGMEGYVQAPVVQQNAAPISVDLSKAPKWLKKPCGASFGFGGKLFTFDHDKGAIAQALQNAQPGETPPVIHRQVYISQVITDADLVLKSVELEQALESGNFTEYCRNKAAENSDQHKKYVWHYLKANFEQNPRAELLNLLGYRIEDVNAKLGDFVDMSSKNAVDALGDEFANINRIEDYDVLQNKYSNAQQKPGAKDYKIRTGDDNEGLIAQALLLNNVDAAVELCLKSKRFADAILIAMTGGPELLARTQFKYLEQCDGYVSYLISALVSEDWGSVINNCDIHSWKEAVAAALTHASDEDLPILCEMMGSRLEQMGVNNKELLSAAQLCYIIAGSFEKLVACWSSSASKSNEDLQELVELITFLQKSVEHQGRAVDISGSLADLLTKYAFILASQGSLNTALNYLGTSQNERVNTLKERLYVALGHKPAYGQLHPRSRQSTARSSIGGYFTQPPKPFSTGLPNVAAPVSQPWQAQTANAASQQPVPHFVPAPAPVAPPSAIPPASATAQPARPGSVGPQGSSLSRNKYLVDPSVKSNNYGTSYNPTPVAPLLHNNFQTNALNSASPYGNAANPPFMPTATPFTPSQANPAYPAAPQSGRFTPSSSYQTAAATTNYAPTMLVPQPMQQPPEMDHQAVGGSSAMNILPAMSAPGWNDPPVFNKPAKSAPKPEMVSQEPINHPIFGSAPVPSIPMNNGYDSASQHYNPYGTVPQEPQQMFQPPPPQAGFNQGFQAAVPPPVQPVQNSFGNPAAFNTRAVVNANAGQQPQQQQGHQGVVEKPAPVPKLPIPEEHIHMQTVFNELRLQCSCTAKNPQTKRKIDDVSKKLEALYDLLRERKLSQNTLTLLHQMVQLVQNGDYAGGLDVHMQLVSGADFAQIASFMPGLKVLLTSASQLGVYLR